jgi:small subunit ribosomal protein S6
LRLYETTFITDSQLSEPEIEAEIKKVEDIIKSSGGQIVETQRWGIRRFAYEINRKRQGFYAHFLYKANPSVPAMVEASFKVNEKIIRFLNVVSQEDLEARARAAEPSTVDVRSTAIPNVIPDIVEDDVVDEPE